MDVIVREKYKVYDVFYDLRCLGEFKCKTKWEGFIKLESTHEAMILCIKDDSLFDKALGVEKKEMTGVVCKATGGLAKIFKYNDNDKT
jgi:hypothetical protein